MTDPDPHASNDARPSKSWLPSPGSLFAALVVVCLVSVVAWQGWRVKRQVERLEYFEMVGAILAFS